MSQKSKRRYLSAVSFIPDPSTGLWMSGQAFYFFLNDDKTGPVIHVAEGDEANGADIPPPWAIFILFLPIGFLVGWADGAVIALILASLSGWLLPRIHSEYLAATFIHDIGLKEHRHLSRATIDRMFFRAMRLTARRTFPLTGIRKFAPSVWGQLTGDLVSVATFLLRIWPRIRPYIMFASVSVFGLIKERHRYFKPQIT